MCKFKEDYLVQCPYYREDEGQAVHCEGVEAHSRLRLGFSERQRKREYMERFCREDWKGCLLTQMLNRKYGYEP